ncbi:MAG: suppressor of fused domain protein [Sandaracinaceae bacterium]
MSWWTKLTGAPIPPPPVAHAAPPTHPAIARVYGPQTPFLLGAMVAFADGGPDPLDAVAIYWHEQGPHFHYFSRGMSGVMGSELTFRLAAASSDRGTEPARFLGSIAYRAPTWPVKMLNMFARRVHRTRRPFLHGEWWEGPPGALSPHTTLRHAIFTRDPELAIEPATPGTHGFLQVTLLPEAVVDAMKADETAGRGDATIERMLRERAPLVTAP